MHPCAFRIIFMFVVSRYVHASYCLPLPESRHLPFRYVLLFCGGEGPSGPWGRAVHSSLHTSSAATFCSNFKKQEELQNSGNVSAWRKLTCLFSCSRNYPALVNKKIVYFWWIYICWQLECHSSSTASLSLPFMWSESNFGLFLSLTAKQSCNNSKWSLEITVTLGFCSNSF